MRESVTPPPGPGRPASRGVVGEFLGLLGSFGDHLQALIALAGLEAREATGLYVRAAIAVVVALVFLVFGYAFFILFVAFALATLLGWSWIWITLGLSVLHFVGVLICFLYMRSRVQSPVFTATSAELQRDLNSLKNFQP